MALHLVVESEPLRRHRTLVLGVLVPLVVDWEAKAGFCD